MHAKQAEGDAKRRAAAAEDEAAQLQSKLRAEQQAAAQLSDRWSEEVTAAREENRGLRIKMETDAVAAAVPGMWQRMGGAGAVALAGGNTNGAAALAPAAVAAGGLKVYDMNNYREDEVHKRVWDGAAGGAGAGARPASSTGSPRSGAAAGAPAPAALTGSELRVAARAVLHDTSGDEVGWCNLKPVLRAPGFGA